MPHYFGHKLFWSSIKTGGVGGAMIAIGIVVETLCSMVISGREKRISSINAQRRTDAEHNTALALQRVANTNLLLEQERTIRAAMLRHQYDRRLDEHEVAALREVARPFVGQMFWIIVQTNGASAPSEQMLFASQLEGTLISEGWTRGGYTGQLYQRLGSSGIEVASGASSSAQIAAIAITNVLTKLHINTRPHLVYNNIAVDLVLIDIGLN
jgi:hypothetical protein